MIQIQIDSKCQNCRQSNPLSFRAHYEYENSGTKVVVEDKKGNIVYDDDIEEDAEEELQYKSFWERLRESFGNKCDSRKKVSNKFLISGAQFTQGGSDSQSEGSSVSGRRSVQMPGPAGIGYGSIT